MLPSFARVLFRNVESSGALVEGVIHLGQQLLHVVGEGAHVRVPVVLRVALQRPEDKWHYPLPVVHNEVDNVLVVPKEERPFRNLKVRRLDARRYLPEQLWQHCRKLSRPRQLQHLFQLTKTQDSFARGSLGPKLEQPRDDVHRQRRVLLHKLGDAEAQLPMITRQTLGHVQGQQGPPKEHFVLLLERQREAVDDGAQDFQQLRRPMVAIRRRRPLPLRLIHKPVEGVRDGPANKHTQRHELAVNAVEDGLEVFAFTRVLRVKQLQQRGHEVLVHNRTGHLGVRLVGHDEPAEHLVRDLHVRPRRLQPRFIVLRIQTVVGRGPHRQGAKQVGRNRRYQGAVDFGREDIGIPRGRELHHIHQSPSLRLLPSKVRPWVAPVNLRLTEVELLDK